MIKQKKENTFLGDFVNEVLARSVLEHKITDVPGKHHPDLHHSRGFAERLDHPAMEDMPILSHAAREKYSAPVHTSDERRTIIEICKRLRANDGSLVRLKLTSSGFDDDFMAQICKSLPGNTCLQYLILHNNSVSDKGMQLLAKAARRHPCLHTIWLGGNDLSDEGAWQMTELIRQNHNVKDVSLSNKWPKTLWTDTQETCHPVITHLGADYFARRLSEGCGLTSLSLADQKLRDLGATLLFEAIPRSQLRYLNIESNELTSKCCVGAKEMLAMSPPLEMLLLSRNEIDDAGAIALAEGLECNDRLKLLDVSYNKLKQDGAVALFGRLSVSTTLTSIPMVGMDLDPSSKQELDKFLSKRKLRINSQKGHLDNSVKASGATSYMDTLDEVAKFKEENQASYEEDQLRISKEHQLPRVDVDVPWASLETPTKQPRAVSSGYFGKRPLSSQRKSCFPPPAVRKKREGPPRHHVDSRRRSLDDSSCSDIGPFVGSDDSSVSSTSPKPPRRLVPLLPLERVSGKSKKSSAKLPRVTESWEEYEGSRKIKQEEEPFEVDDPTLPNVWSEIDRNLKKKQALAEQERLIKDIVHKEKPPLSSFEQQSLNRKKNKRSCDLGKTLGVPDLGHFGTLPIRTHIKPYSDSGQHQMYLRLVTPNDPPSAAPYPILKVVKDKEKMRQRVIEKHHQPLFMMKRAVAKNVSRARYMKNSDKPAIPDKFWEQWTHETREKYPHGIDLANDAARRRHNERVQEKTAKAIFLNPWMKKKEAKESID